MAINNQGTIQDKKTRQKYMDKYEKIKWEYMCSKCKELVRGIHKC